MNISNPYGNPILLCYCVIIICLYIQENYSLERLRKLSKKVIELEFDFSLWAPMHVKKVPKVFSIYHMALP